MTRPCARSFDSAAEALGGLDVVVANAGIAAGGPLHRQDLRSAEGESNGRDRRKV
jgi:NAD(P)-dependent dehydrogenase (short-subunit alcohol dehydrogenase family)